MYTLVNEFRRSGADRARSVQIHPKTRRVEIIASELTHGEGGNLALLHFTSLPLRVRIMKDHLITIASVTIRFSDLIVAQ